MINNAGRNERPAMLESCDQSWLEQRVADFAQIATLSPAQHKFVDALLLEQARRQQQSQL